MLLLFLFFAKNENGKKGKRANNKGKIIEKGIKELELFYMIYVLVTFSHIIISYCRLNYFWN